MEIVLQLNATAIEFLTGMITGDNGYGWRRSGPDLVALFNNFGFADSYGQGFPSRNSFCRERLNECNGTNKLSQVICEILNPIHFIGREEFHKSAIDKLNKYLEFDDYKVELRGKSCIVLRLHPTDVTAANIDKLSDEFVQEQIHKCEEKLGIGDSDGAITNARSLIEGVLNCIHYEILGVVLDKSGDLQKDYKKVRDLLNMSPEKYSDEAIRQVLNGFQSIVSGIDSLSNQMGDRHRRRVKPDIRHARLVTNAAKTIISFLIETYHFQCRQK
ncbi:hypothetical protein EHM69_04200 [candidate division KSB1 bacterium]|nr:MAG: hypothetical protein EHM69_04200 [candidate division KSB1 bacterium]